MTRVEYDKIVKGPGKFEGENSYIPYFWGVVNQGEAELEYLDDNGFEDCCYWVTVSEDDRELFPELKAGERIPIYEDDNGFVREITVELDTSKL